jgi:L-demethylnoviosyl transferase
MRVLVTSSALEGHFFPIVPTAWALRAQGHEVVVSAPANFSDRITSAGLFAANVVPAIEFDQFMRHDRDGTPLPMPAEPAAKREYSGRAWGRLAAHCLPANQRLVESYRPDLVISEPDEFSGPMLAARHDIPLVEHGWGMTTMPDWKPAANQELAGELAALDIPEIPEPDVRLDNCPEGLRRDTDVTGWTMRYVPYNGSGVFPEWTLSRPDRPQALITMGSLFPRYGRKDFIVILREFAQALTELGADLVVGLPDDMADDGVLPPGARRAGWLPLQAALPVCRLIAHHGGVGSTITSVLYGVPQLVLPRVVDQFANAARVVDAGVGLSLQPDEVSSAAFADRCARLLAEPAYAENAVKIAAENETRPTPSDVARRLARFVTGS